MKKVFFFIVALLSVASVSGQSRVWEMPTVPSDTSIVRHWRNGEYIVYTRRAGLPGEVMYHNSITGNLRKADLPSGAVINDFRIFNDTVFAGGSLQLGGHNVGLLACFAINDLLTGSCTFHGTSLNYSNMSNDECSNPDNYDWITGIRRLDVFSFRGRPVVAFISDNVILTDYFTFSGIQYRRIGCGDALFQNSSWFINPYHYNKDGQDKYTDIAVMDNYVAVVSHDTVYDLAGFELYSKGVSFASHPIPVGSGTTVYSFTDHEVEGRVMATALEGDLFAVAYHYKDPSGASGLSLKWISVSAGVPTIQYSIDIPLPAVGGREMRDVRYSRQSNSLWVLADEAEQTTGLWGSYIHRVDMGNVYAGMYEERYYPGYKLYSLDGYDGGGHIVGGMMNGHLTVCGEKMLPLPIYCYTQQTVKGDRTAPTMSVVGHHHCMTGPGWINGSMVVPVVDIPVDLICEN